MLNAYAILGRYLRGSVGVSVTVVRSSRSPRLGWVVKVGFVRGVARKFGERGEGRVRSRRGSDACWQVIFGGTSVR